MIEVLIAEVRRDKNLSFGVDVDLGQTTVSKGAGTTATGTMSGAGNPGLGDFALRVMGIGGINLDATLRAVAGRGTVSVVSRPVVLTANNQEAEIVVGSQRPFVQVSRSLPTDGAIRDQVVQYRDVGTTLTLLPTINPDGYVNMQVTQTDNSATNEVQFDAPIINKREATTQVFIRDGQTTVIGGLANHTRSTDVSGIPFLSQIPLFGPLIFGRTTRNDETSELFLFLTPHVIFGDQDVDKLRDAVKEGSDLLKQVETGARIVPKTDTIPIKSDTTVKPDSLTMLRRRPPAPESPWR
jgi:type II secretory pathway component GspD/PulD (secretin)